MTRNLQPTLDFGLTYRVDEEFKSSMRALNDAYEAAGNLVVAGATGIDKSDLPKMFEPGSGRHLRYKAVFTIGTLASLELRRRALEPLAECWGLKVSVPEPMDDKDARVVLEAALRALGPVGEQALRAAYGGRR
jgi:hypothetical protein